MFRTALVACSFPCELSDTIYAYAQGERATTTVSASAESVPVPQPTPETIPDATVGWGSEPVTVPTAGGYVEVTELCGMDIPCRVQP